MLETSVEQTLEKLSPKTLKGVGLHLEKQLANINIHSIQDILFHLPIRYEDRTRLMKIGAVRPHQRVVVTGTIEVVDTIRHKKPQLICRISDGTGSVILRFFHFTAAQRQRLIVGSRLLCFGEMRVGRHGLEIVHPEYKQIALEEEIVLQDRLTPIYPTTKGLSQRSWMNLTTQALTKLNESAAPAELFSGPILKKYNLPTIKEALNYIHRPERGANIESLLEGKHVMQKRLIIEELLAHRLALLKLRHDSKKNSAIALTKSGGYKKSFLSRLPFSLTAAQQRVIEEIESDLLQPHPMMRLVQGDVGSGKTVVAAMAMLRAVAGGCQAAMMAPTELLAEQHYRVIAQWFDSLNIKVAFLKGGLRKKAREEILSELLDGSVQVIVGTHALFQEGVIFNKLALMVVDEQHRFGVQQRLMLRDKGGCEDMVPHQLIMTATPIPRTLAMSAYADLDCSVIDELPPGRKSVKTIALANSKRAEIINRIQDVCHAGQQVYWVCPLIEESEVLQCQAAEDSLVLLSQALPSLKIALVHGRMKASEKESVMQAFKAGESHVLVATTVIEVGVDVPNATLMVIENAERLGLSQLHQLRGRVGRGSQHSYCVLFYQTPLSQLAKSRINVLRDTNDGFLVSEKDLELRGPGEVLGTRQTGVVGMKIANIVRDKALLPEVAIIADDIVQSAPGSAQKLINRWLGVKQDFGNV